MRTHTSRQSLLFVLLAGLVAPLPARAEDFSIVLHPGTHLNPDPELFSDGRRTYNSAFSSYSRTKPVVVSGRSPKDAPDTASFILHLENPRTADFSDVEEGTPVGSNRPKRFPYKGVNVVQPFSLWHRAAPGAQPVLLGRGFTWNDASQIRDLGVDGPYRRFQVIDRSTPEMVQMAIQEKLEDLPSLLADAWSPNVIHQAPRHNVTPQRAFELLAQSKSTTVSSSLLEIETTYHPSRVSRNSDGAVVVELDLWNRLPVRASGKLSCRAARIPYPSSFLTYEQMKSIQQQREARRHFITCEFDLAPGQKDVARFVIPPEVGADPQLFRDDEIIMHGSSGLGPSDADTRGGKAGRNNKKKKK